MGNMHKLLNPPEFDWATEQSLKSLKLFRTILRTFSLRKFSSNPKILATIDTDKYTLDEFLIFTGDFEIKTYPAKRSITVYWLKCCKNEIGINYKTFFKKHGEFCSLYLKWDDEYFDHFRGFTFKERFAILKEI
jgi:hypothetical protein